MALNVWVDLSFGKFVRSVVEKAGKGLRDEGEFPLQYQGKSDTRLGRPEKQSVMKAIDAAYMRYQDHCKSKILAVKREIPGRGQVTDGTSRV
jgi:hypothetical protein